MQCHDEYIKMNISKDLAKISICFEFLPKEI